MCVPAAIGYADEIQDKTIEQTVIQDEILREQQQLDVLSNQYTEAIIEKEKIEEEIKEVENQIANTETQIKETKEQLSKQAVNTYKNGSVALLDVLLDTSSFEELNTNLDYCSRIMQNSDNLIKKNNKLQNELTNQQEQLQNQQVQLQQKMQEIEEAKEMANLKIENLQQQYEQLNIDIAQLSVQNIVTYDQPFTEEELVQVVQTLKAENPHMSDGDVVSRAYAMLGSPYAWGGTTSAGFDCSGFVSYCLTGEEGTRLGTTNTFMGWNQTSNPQPGDICVNDGHTGIYVGDGRMIHASTYGVGVVESDVQDGMIFVTYN